MADGNGIFIKVSGKVMSLSAHYFNLQRLILALAMVSSVAMLCNAVWASYQVLRDQLFENSLESNRVYADKLAQSAQYFILTAQQELAYSAALLARAEGNASVQSEEVDRLKHQTDSFNAIAIVDARGVIQAAAPVASARLGGRFAGDGAEVLASRVPMVSDPFTEEDGSLKINISQPIMDRGGRYFGRIIASIHLKETNILHSLLGSHSYRDGAYIYVIGRDGRVLYHPDARKIGRFSSDSDLARVISTRSSGSLHRVSSSGVHMIAGFASVPSTGWGVVAQRPAAATLEPLMGLVSAVVKNAAPIGLLSLLAIWLCSRAIASPLWKLATSVQVRDVREAMLRVHAVNSWYFEAAQLKSSVLTSLGGLSERIGALDLASMTDPLTQLLNRRGVGRAIEEIRYLEQGFAVVAIDIDNFKGVNDIYGHDVGDQVIVQVANLVRANARPNDILSRFGGEEFLLLLPATDVGSALQVAERLRVAIEEFEFPAVQRVTISAGISHFPVLGPNPEDAIQQSDVALYLAKRTGRNCVALFGSDGLGESP